MSVRTNIIPDQWMEPPEWSVCIQNDDDIRAAIKEKIFNVSSRDLSEKQGITERCMQNWSSARKKFFSVAEWKKLQPVIGMEREVVIKERYLDEFSDYQTMKQDVFKYGLDWKSEKLGLEAYEALSHYLSRYYHRIAVKKISEQLGIAEALLQNQGRALSPYTVVGQDNKERIRQVCNETWPDRFKMLEVYRQFRDFFPKESSGNNILPEESEKKSDNHVPADSKRIVSNNRIGNNSGCCVIFMFFIALVIFCFL